MMDLFFSNLLPFIAFLAGVFSASTTITSFVISNIRQKKTLDEINEAKFRHALLSGDIKLLGNYLDKTLGNIKISEYTSNPKIQTRVDSYIQNITNFIGKEEDINKQTIEKSSNDNFYYKEIPHELQEIAREFRVGHTWNALAKLRSHIELVLKQKLKEINFPAKEYITINKMLSILRSTKILSDSVVSNIRFSVSICNKAIHGVDISEIEAEQAFLHAIQALNDLKGSHTDNF